MRAIACVGTHGFISGWTEKDSGGYLVHTLTFIVRACWVAETARKSRDELFLSGTKTKALAAQHCVCNTVWSLAHGRDGWVLRTMN